MQKVMMTDITTVSFFQELGTAVGGTAGEFISDCAGALNLHFLAHYSGLYALPAFAATSVMTDEIRARYCAYRFGLSAQKVFDALNAEYDPLANTSVTETESNDGTDVARRTGTDTSNLTNSSTTHYGTTFDSPTEHETGKSSSTAASSVTYGRTDTIEHGKEVTKTKNGNIGVMPTQDLMGLEYRARIRMNMFEFLSVVLCMCFSCGVWESGEDNGD